MSIRVIGICRRAGQGEDRVPQPRAHDGRRRKHRSNVSLSFLFEKTPLQSGGRIERRATLSKEEKIIACWHSRPAFLKQLQGLQPARRRLRIPNRLTQQFGAGTHQDPGPGPDAIDLGRTFTDSCRVNRVLFQTIRRDLLDALSKENLRNMIDFTPPCRWTDGGLDATNPSVATGLGNSKEKRTAPQFHERSPGIFIVRRRLGNRLLQETLHRWFDQDSTNSRVRPTLCCSDDIGYFDVDQAAGRCNLARRQGIPALAPEKYPNRDEQ